MATPSLLSKVIESQGQDTEILSIRDWVQSDTVTKAVHPGGIKMYHDLRHQYDWSGMKKHVGDFVRRCLSTKD